MHYVCFYHGLTQYVFKDNAKDQHNKFLFVTLLHSTERDCLLESLFRGSRNECDTVHSSFQFNLIWTEVHLN